MRRIFAKLGLIAGLIAIPLAIPAMAAARSHDTTPAPAPVYTYTAEIDCGWGTMTVLSTDDVYAPLFDPASGRS